METRREVIVILNGREIQRLRAIITRARRAGIRLSREESEAVCALTRIAKSGLGLR